MLSDYASNIYSYAGEDGMIAELLKRLNVETGTCVEFGAWDGVECSNTAALRERGWKTILIEGEEDRFEDLTKLASNTVTCVNAFVSPEGENSIDNILKGEPVDVMSIDIDGDDYFILASMDTKPRILIIEYNQTVPWFLDVRGATVGNRFGASALSLHRLARAKGYEIVGATETNLIFVDSRQGVAVTDFLHGYEEIMLELPLRFGITFTNYTCDEYTMNFGNLPKWGWRSEDPIDKLVHGPILYPGKSKAISDRFSNERV